jgi:murein DD-endopeptidase MepM/ murein hydrolase activator NlpD
VPRKSTGLACLRTAFAGVVLLSASAAGAQEASERPSGDILLTDQLERIAEQRDITFKGLDKTFGVPAPRNGEVDWDRLGLPLSEFNHTVVHTPDGTVKQVIIMGPKRRAAALTAPIPRRRPVLAETPAAAPVNGAGPASAKQLQRAILSAPPEKVRVSSRYGRRMHPVLGYNRQHRAIDFAAPAGTPIKAPSDGQVVRAGRNGAYGNYIRIDHGNGYQTAYGHLQRIAANAGEAARVRAGQVIGYVGSTGRSTGPHLHYELWINGQPVNPEGVALPAGARDFWSSRIIEINALP